MLAGEGIDLKKYLPSVIMTLMLILTAAVCIATENRMQRSGGQQGGKNILVVRR